MKIIKISYPTWNANHDRKVLVVNFGGEEYVLYLPISPKMYLGEEAMSQVSEEMIKKAIISYLCGKYFYEPFSCIRHMALEDKDRSRGRNAVVKLILSSWYPEGLSINDRIEAIKKIYSSRSVEEGEEVMGMLENQ